MAGIFANIVPEGILLSRYCLGGLTSLRNGYQGVRFLFSPSALGVDGYIRARDRTKLQFVNMGEKFKTKMVEFADPESANMIFTEDLKNMIYLTEDCSSDFDLIHKMMKRFNQQNKEMRFGSFIFGPVVMRMYYFLNKPEEALSVFRDPLLEDFFSQLGTYQILMDLLFENKMYQEVLDVFKVVKERQHQESRYPKNIILLTFAACYKLNTEESFNYGMDLWKELKSIGHNPMRRTVTFAGALAMNQNSPHIALEVISSILQQNYVTIRNIKVGALADVGRPEDAFPILKSVIDSDVPVLKKQTFCEDICKKVEEAVQKKGDKQMTYEYDTIMKRLTEGDHISRKNLDHFLCTQIAEILKSPVMERNQRYLAASFNRQDHSRSRAYARPGLKDMY